MILVAGEIPEFPRRIIEFLAIQMSPAEVLGVEVPHHVSKEGIAYAPTSAGRTATARSKITASGGEPWDRDRFLETARDAFPTKAAASRKTGQCAEEAV